MIPLFETDFSVSIAQYSYTKKTARRNSLDCQKSNVTGGLFGEDEYQSWFTVHKAREWLHGGCLPWTEPYLQKTKFYVAILGHGVGSFALSLVPKSSSLLVHILVYFTVHKTVFLSY